MELATFGMGCFWCSEAMFSQLKGVQKVQSGFSGGTTVNPSYRDVCTGETGHAEVVQISYDPEQISYAELLKIFFTMHDPTTLNRQGADMGTQYRSVIFTHTQQQREEALLPFESNFPALETLDSSVLGLYDRKTPKSSDAVLPPS